MVIRLYKQGVPPKEIAHQLHMSLRDVYAILKREFGEKQRKELSDELKAITLYRLGKYPIEVTIKLRITPEEAIKYYLKFMDLTYLGKFGETYEKMKDKLPELSPICDAIRAGVITAQEFISASRIEQSVAELEGRNLSLIREEQELRAKIEALNSEIILAETSLCSTEYDLEQAQSRLSKINSELQEAEDRLTLTYQHLNYNNSIQNHSNNYNPYVTFGYFNRANYW